MFPDEWFEDEIRDGFYVDGMMKCCWAAQLELLKAVDDICRRHGIRWFMDNGTLLGAVRHGGYIPWDDDLDICMLRDDYVRFTEVAPKELEPPAFLGNFRNTDDYWELLSKVASGNQVDPRPPHMEKYHNFPYVATVDIFPIDFLAPDPQKEELRVNMAKIASALCNVGDIDDENRSADTLNLIHTVEDLCNYRFDKKRSVKLQVYELLENFFTLYGREEAEEVALMPFWVENGSHKYKKSWFEDVVYLPFENMMLPAPACFDAVLRTEYGDYMRTVHAGGVHDYPYYASMEPDLSKFYGGTIPINYTFSRDELCVRHAGRKQGTKSRALEFAALLREVHKEILGHIGSGDAISAASLLEQCQEGAIRIGTSIEEAAGEGFVTVKRFEEYCEALYQLHEALPDRVAEDIEALCRRLDEALSGMEKSIKNDFEDRKEVVFLPFKPSAWENMEHAWRKEKEDPFTEVKVVPIPYFYKNPDGTNSDIRYDLSAYPDHLNVINCNEYDFAGKHPDRIYIQNPYDDYNYKTTVHPFFYSKNIKNHTDELVYIPYFSEEDPEPTDGKAKKMMERYVTMPGVFHSDRIILQSEALKQAYTDKLCEFAGEETRELWEKKIEVDTEIYQKPAERERNEGIVPGEWRKNIYGENGEKKKIIIYHTTVSSIAQFGEKAIEKIRNVFRIFDENKDRIALIWKPQPLRYSSVGENHPKLLSSFEKLEEEYKTRGYGIYDDLEADDPALGLSDAYYGDASPLAYKCRNLGLPVMIQDVTINL